MSDSSVSSFFNRHNIKFLPINLKLNNGRNMAYLDNKMLTYTSFCNRNLEECQHIYTNPKYKDYEYIASDTYDIQRIDIDDVELFEKYCPVDILERLKSGPYYLSRNKRLPHYIVKLEGFTKCNTQVKAFEKTEDNKNIVICDMLNGQYAWLRRNEEVINFDSDIVNLTYTQLNELINISNIKNKEFQLLNKSKINQEKEEDKLKKLEEQAEMKLRRSQEKEIAKLQKLEEQAEMKLLAIKEKAEMKFLAIKEKEANLNLLKNLKITEEQKMKYVLDSLSLARSDTYADWIIVGMILYNKFNGNDRGFKLYDYFSKKSDKYNLDSVTQKWSTYKFSVDGLSEKTLYQMAIDDNFNNNYTNYLLYSDLIRIQVNDTFMGEYFHKIYKNTLICSRLGSQPVWHHYQKAIGLWTTETSNDYVIGLLKQSKIKLNKLINDSKYNLYDTDQFDHNIVDKLIERAEEFYGTFLEARTLKSAFSISTGLFYDKTFESKLNSKIDLFSFGKDVYDLKNLCWRETRADDLISIKSGFTKEEILNCDTTKAKDLFMDIFSVDEQYEYIMNVFSSCLYGSNILEQFYIFSGTGANGKSLVDCYLKRCFGEYYGILPIDYLTNRQNGTSNQASPVLANLRYSRITVSSEPEEGSKIQNSTIKILTGGDGLTCRQLYGNPFQFVPQFKPFILCNLSFSFQDSSDDSIQRRCVFNKFTNSYVFNPNTKLKHEKKIDLNLKNQDNVELISKGLMKLLLEFWENKYKDNRENHEIPQPAILQEWKEEFMDNSNIVKQFVDEKLQICEEESFIQFKDLYMEYKEFCKQNNEHYNVNKSAIMARFLKLLPTFKSRHLVVDDNGKRKEYRNTFLNIKHVEDNNCMF